MQRNPSRKLRENIISWVSLIVIFLSAYGMLKTILDVPSTQSGRTKTVPSTVTSNSSVLRLSPPPGVRPAAGATQSAPAASDPSTITSNSSILLASPTPGAKLAAGAPQSAPAASVPSTITSNASILPASPTPGAV